VLLVSALLSEQDGDGTAIPFIAEDFHLLPVAIGIVLSAFFGYTLIQIPADLLSDRLGPRFVLIGSIAWFALMTAATGLAPGLWMIAVRAAHGVGEGLFPTAAAKAFSNWSANVGQGGRTAYNLPRVE
jgi:MFS family permease